MVMDQVTSDPDILQLRMNHLLELKKQNYGINNNVYDSFSRTSQAGKLPRCDGNLREDFTPPPEATVQWHTPSNATLQEIDSLKINLPTNVINLGSSISTEREFPALFSPIRSPVNKSTSVPKARTSRSPVKDHTDISLIPCPVVEPQLNVDRLRSITYTDPGGKKGKSLSEELLVYKSCLPGFSRKTTWTQKLRGLEKLRSTMSVRGTQNFKAPEYTENFPKSNQTREVADEIGNLASRQEVPHDHSTLTSSSMEGLYIAGGGSRTYSPRPNNSRAKRSKDRFPSQSQQSSRTNVKGRVTPQYYFSKSVASLHVTGDTPRVSHTVFSSNSVLDHPLWRPRDSYPTQEGLLQLSRRQRLLKLAETYCRVTDTSRQNARDKLLLNREQPRYRKVVNSI